MVPSLPVTLCAAAGDPGCPTDDVITGRAAVVGVVVAPDEGAMVTWVVVRIVSDVLVTCEELDVVGAASVVESWAVVVDSLNRIKSIFSTHQ